VLAGRGGDALILGYNTNGFSQHSISAAIEFIAQLGYESIAISLDRGILHPPGRSRVRKAIDLLKPLLDATGVRVTIETGARYVLDPHRKHYPTLISRSPAERRRRVEFLKDAVEIAAALSADSVSLWSGAPDADEPRAALFDRLVGGLQETLDHAAQRNVRLSFEPEPDMLIDTMAGFETLYDRLEHPMFGLTLDVGHVHCLNDGDLAKHIHRWHHVLWNVHVEDMRRGVHEHLMFGEGEMDFASVFDAFSAAEYAGPVHVELSRHSHAAEEAARKSYDFLRTFIC